MRDACNTRETHKVREGHEPRDPRGPRLPDVRVEHRGSAADKEVPRKPQLPVREWDRDKLRQETPPPVCPREPSGAARRSKDARTPDKKERRDKKVEKRKQESTPAKLLDDLFRKTKASPCIYWLPLTDDQIVHKEEERKQQLLDRERRRQQQRLQEEEERRKRSLARDLHSNARDSSKRTGSHSTARRR